MSSAAGTVENASIISESVAHDGNRLWIGNIDPKITEWVHYRVSALPACLPPPPIYLKDVPLSILFLLFYRLWLYNECVPVGNIYVSDEIGAETTCETL